MGSQNVTRYSPTKMKRIWAGISDYDPESFQADQLVRSAGISTIGNLTKSSSFVQCLSSQSTKYGLELLISLAERVKESKKPEDLSLVLKKEYGVTPGSPKPLERIMSNMTEILSVKLASKSEENDAAPAAKSAVTQTLIDVLSEGESAKAIGRQEEIASAFRKIRLDKIATLFYTNVITSLVNQSLDAARGKIPPNRVNELKEEIRAKFAPELTRIIVNLAKRQGISATELPSHVSQPKLLSQVKQKTDDWVMIDEQISKGTKPEKKRTSNGKKKTAK